MIEILLFIYVISATIILTTLCQAFQEESCLPKNLFFTVLILLFLSYVLTPVFIYDIIRVKFAYLD